MRKAQVCVYAAMALALITATSLVDCGPLSASPQKQNNATNWPGWRGNGSGVSTERKLPLYWSVNDGVAWKTALLGEGNSSPVIWGNRIFVTSSTEKGKKRQVMCLDAKTGRMLWRKEFAANSVGPTHPKSGYASSTPVTDGKRLYVFFDSPGLIALDMSGKVVWTHPLGPFNNPYNVVSSPVLCRDCVIMTCDQSGPSYIAAFDRATGKIRWKTPRKGGFDYATPLVITVRGKQQIVVNGPTAYAYDPQSGKELWWCRGMTDAVTPSAVFDNGLVYLTSGRNGPTKAVDPTGSGDITESHVRMQVMTGGPYVPSPVVYQFLLVPNDMGVLRAWDMQGNTLVNERFGGQFTTSLAAGGGYVYWTNEKGDTYVLKIDNDTPGKPTVTRTAVNSIAETCLASPAFAHGRVYIRGNKHLFCISGVDRPKTKAAESRTAGFDELKKSIEEHSGLDEGDPNIVLRCGLVEEMGGVRDPRAIGFLKDVAINDHWDVAEKAMKALAQQGEAAVPVLRDFLGDSRGFARTLAAQSLASIGSTASLPALIKAAQGSDSLTRGVCLEALGTIASTHISEADAVVPALVAGIGDSEGSVRTASIRALGRLGGSTGECRSSAIDALSMATADKNPLVASEAVDALVKGYGMSREKISRNIKLYGWQRPEPVVEHLRAGPVRLKFQDGELRYLYVGDKEIVRRIYFAVRDSTWDTAMPKFSKIKVDKRSDSFSIQLEAACKNEHADYQWSGEITGASDGKITFSVTGQPNSDFSTPRVGLNVLYGGESLNGQKYEVTDENGVTTAAYFPREISTALLVGINTSRSLSYVTDDGMRVACHLTGAKFGVEDQRSMCDSSYKLFTSLAYKYPGITKGDRRSETLTIEVAGAKSSVDTPAKSTKVTIGHALAGAKMPKLLAAAESQQAAPDAAGSTTLKLLFNPSIHLPDDDTFFENVSSLIDQVKAARLATPNATIRIDPISFEAYHPRPRRDPRNQGLFASAWTACMIKYLAEAGVDEAVFTVGPGYCDMVQRMMERHAGERVLAAQVSAQAPAAVQAFAVHADRGRVLWLINSTDSEQHVIVAGLSAASPVRLFRLNEKADAKTEPVDRPAQIKDGTLGLRLLPFEVCRITLSP